MRAVGRVHALHALGGGELIGLSGLADLYAAGNPGIGAGAQRVGVKALRSTYTSGALAAVAEKYGDGVVGVAGLNPDRTLDFLSVELEFDNVFCVDLQPFGHLGADEDGVVPGELGHGLGER